MSYKIAILDRDSEYVVSLMEYMNAHKNRQLIACMFSNSESLAAYIEEYRVDAILTGIDISQCGVPVFRLTELRDEACKENYIYKYQNIEVMIDHILNCIKTEYVERVKSKSFISVFSPIGRCGKTKLAMAICECCEQSLYIGMEEYRGFDIKKLREEERGYKKAPSEGLIKKDMNEDFYYYLASRNTRILDTIDSLPHLDGDDKNRIGVMMGAMSFHDIRQIRQEDIIWFKELMKDRNQVVVFDIGGGSIEDLGILQVMDKIYVPVLEDDVSKRKLLMFEKILEREGYSEIREKISYINVPDSDYNSGVMKQCLMEGENKMCRI